MSAIDVLFANNAAYVADFDRADLPLPPATKVAVIACMDARLNVFGALGLQEGDAHVIRNAGGVVTDDAIRSLAISQRLLGTEEIVLIHHTGCGMLTFNDEAFKRSIQDETGSNRSGRRKRSTTSTRTSASRSPGSRRTRSPPPRQRPRVRLRREHGRLPRGHLTTRSVGHMTSPTPGRRR